MLSKRSAWMLSGGDFIEFYYEALKPWVHYVPVREDMADMDEKLTWARENDDAAKQVRCSC